MNTDKLLELERKWRGMNCRTEAQDRVYRVCADQLAAALRAEQAVGGDGRLPCPFGDACVGRDCNRCGNFTPAKPKAHEVKAVGDEQRARELLADVFAQNDAWMHAKTVRSGVNIDVPMEMALIAITRALGTARQSEGMAVVPKRPTEAMLEAGRDAVMARDCSSSEWGPADHYEAAGISRKGIPEHLFEGKGKMSKAWGAELVYAAMLAAAPGGEGEG